MKQNNAQRVIENYMYNHTYFEPTDRIRVDSAGNVTCNNTPIGYFKSGYSNITDEYIDFLVLTLQTYKSDRYWERAKRELVKAANDHDIIVVFKSEIDIGFGKTLRLQEYMPDSEAMICAAKFSNTIRANPSPKLSAFGKDIDWDLRGEDEPDNIYSCYQWHNNYVIKPEIAILLYITRDCSNEYVQPRYELYLMEQCDYDTLSILVRHNITFIGYCITYRGEIGELHFELLDKIWSREIRHKGYPLKCQLYTDKKIEKYCLKQLALEGVNKC